jgi:hypothetical protein
MLLGCMARTCLNFKSQVTAARTTSQQRRFAHWNKRD